MSQAQYTRAVTLATTKQLIAFYNEHAIKPVTKFADRQTAEKRVLVLIQDMIYNATNPRGEERRIMEVLSGVAVEPAEQPAAAAEQPVIGEFTHCPSCGVHLSNGYQTYDNLYEDKEGRSVASKMKHEYMCLGCGHEFGPALKKSQYVRPSGAPITQRPAMAASLKLDRQILSVNSGIVYKNACQVWKAGLVSAAQGDRLSAVLYGEAKKGNRLMSVTINGHVFTLAVK